MLITPAPAQPGNQRSLAGLVAVPAQGTLWLGLCCSCGVFLLHPLPQTRCLFCLCPALGTQREARLAQHRGDTVLTVSHPPGAATCLTWNFGRLFSHPVPSQERWELGNAREKRGWEMSRASQPLSGRLFFPLSHTEMRTCLPKSCSSPVTYQEGFLPHSSLPFSSSKRCPE